MMESPVETTYELRSHSLLPVGPRMTDKADSCGELSTAVITGKASCICDGLGCGDGLTCRTFPSAALLYYSDNTNFLKVLHPGETSFCHLDLFSARSSQVAGSMPVDSRLAFRLSLKRSSGRQLGRVPDSNSA